MRPHRIALLSTFVLLALAATSAQNNPSENTAGSSVLTTTSRSVIVDVVVTTGTGEPIVGLGKQDFQVLEDGKPQSIEFFEEHTAANPSAAPLPVLPPHVFTNQPTALPGGTVTMLLLDSLNTEPADRARVIAQVADFLRTLHPGDRVALFALNTKLKLLQGFTDDIALLQAALNSETVTGVKTIDTRTREDDLRDKELVSMAGNAFSAQAQARSLNEYAQTKQGAQASITLTALDQLARSLAAIPGRKNVLWFATRFPVSVFPNGPERQTESNGRELPEDVRQSANLLTQSRVALYPVSAQGILIDSTMDADTSGQPEGNDFARAPLQQTTANAANTAAMEQLARDTGGKAIYTTNDLKQAAARVVENGSRYYTLAYTPTDGKLDGKFRRIEVKLTQGKYQLAYRRGYFADDATAANAKPALDPLVPLMVRGLPSNTQIVYRLKMLPDPAQPAPDAPRAGGNQQLAGHVTRYKVEFVIPAAGLNFIDAPDGGHSVKVEVALVAYGHDGTTLNWTGGTMTMNLNAASYAKAQRTGIAAPIEIDLPDVNVDLATGIYDLDSRPAGTLEIPVSAAADATGGSDPGAH